MRSGVPMSFELNCFGIHRDCQEFAAGRRLLPLLRTNGAEVPHPANDDSNLVDCLLGKPWMCASRRWSLTTIRDLEFSSNISSRRSTPNCRLLPEKQVFCRSPITAFRAAATDIKDEGYATQVRLNYERQENQTAYLPFAGHHPGIAHWPALHIRLKVHNSCAFASGAGLRRLFT